MNEEINPTQCAEQPDPARFNLAMFRSRRAQEYRCKACARLLGRFVFVPGLYANMKCPRCGFHNVEDVALNSTSAAVLVELLDRLNGHTPEAVLEAAGRLVERVNITQENEG